MFCPNCGTALPDGCKFCSACGGKITVSAPVDTMPAVQATVNTAPTPASVNSVPTSAPVNSVPTPAPVNSVPTPTPVNPVPTPTPVNPAPTPAPAPVNSVPTPAPVNPVPTPTPVNAAPTPAPVNPAPAQAPVNSAPAAAAKKPVNKKLIGIIAAAAAAVVVIVGCIIGFGAMFSGSAGGDAYAYISNGKYNLFTNLNSKDGTIEISSTKSTSTSLDMLQFSPDGKYVYFLTKYDSYSGTGTLCRAECGRLRPNSTKNEEFIDVIATNVYSCEFLDNGSLLYRNGENTLYFYDGNEPAQISKNVGAFVTDDSGRIVYSTGDYDDNGYMIYGAKLDDIDNKTKLATGANIVDSSDFDHILYTKTEEDGSLTLYSTGFETEAEKLAEKVNILAFGDGTMYFTTENDEKLSLYDYVDDKYADSDAKITEPTYEEFSTPRYNYDMVYGSDLNEDDFDELYTSCTKNLYWYGESTWWAYSMEDSLDMDWGENTDRIHSATRRFIDRFADKADENGMILVTPEVRAALMDIQKCGEDPEQEWKWMWLCYYKYQSGTNTDYDAYNAAYDKWREAYNRNSTREMLKNPENARSVYTLYCYKDGAVTEVCGNMLGNYPYNYYNNSGAVIYNTVDMIDGSVPIDELYSVWDVTALFNIDYAAENYIALPDGTTCCMSAAAADTYSEAYNNSGATLYFGKAEVYLSESNGALSVAEISGGAVGAFSLVTDDAKVAAVNDGVLYYTSGSYSNGGMTYCDLYSYAGGTSTRIARDILASTVVRYSDKTLIVDTGFRSGYGYEVTMIKPNGDVELIADNVTQIIRLDENRLLYISDGDLYYCSGKEKRMVRSDVDAVWSRNQTEPELHLYLGYLY